METTNKANAMLSKLRHVLNVKTLRSAFYAVFESHLCHASLAWVQNTNSVNRLHLLENLSECSFKAEIPHRPFI